MIEKGKKNPTQIQKGKTPVSVEAEATASYSQDTTATVSLKTKPRLSSPNLVPPTAAHHCIQSQWRVCDKQLTWVSFINLGNTRLSIYKYLKHVSTYKISYTKEDTIPCSLI